jgi:hypothetical protein
MADKNLAMTSPDTAAIRPYADGDADHIFDLIILMRSHYIEVNNPASLPRILHGG